MNINPTVKKVAAAAGGLALGFVGGYAIGYIRAKKAFIEHIDETIHDILEEEKLKNEKSLLRKDDFPTPQSIRPDAEVGATPIFDELVTNYGGHTLDELREMPAPSEAEVAEKLRLEELREHLTNGAIQPRNPQEPEEEEGEVTELDRTTRTLDKPYVISIDEYHDEDEDQERVTIKWYTGGEDSVLVDERDQVIDNVDYVVGEENLTRFGEGSQDPNIVYIRNHQNGIDYEVVRSKRSYLEDVLGVPETRTDLPMRSMREGDDD